MSEPVRRRRIISIRWIISGAVILLTALTVLGVGGIGEHNARQALNQEVGGRLMFEARHLALVSSRALLSEFPELTLQPVLKEMQNGRGHLLFAAVLGPDGTVIGHTDARQLGASFAWPAPLGPVDFRVRLERHEGFFDTGDMLLARVPIRHSSGETLGTVAIGFRRDYVDVIIRAARRQQLIAVAVLLLIGVGTAAVLMGVLLRPVAKLREGLERIGRGDLETPVELEDRTELGLLAETMNDMATRVREARVELVKKEHLAREMALAREIQASLLPGSETRVDSFVIGGSHRAAAEVGGDFYDVFKVPDGRIAIAIADVSGKGLGGCMVTSMLAALLRAFRFTELDPRSLLVRLERSLCESLRRGTFVTMFYGILDPTTGRLVCASAGHTPTLIYRAATESVEWVRSSGIPIGAVRGGALDRTLVNRTVELGVGDVLVQYTDGINEAFSPERKQFGFDRLGDVVRDTATQGCASVIESIRVAVKRWSKATTPDDDETLLVVSRELPALAGAAVAAEPVEDSDVEQALQQMETPERAAAVLTLLATAREVGSRVTVAADFQSLTKVRDWLGDWPAYTRLSGTEAILIEIALWEVCANIIEHGYGEDRECSFELLCAPSTSPTRGSRSETFRFIVVDQGVSFRPEGRKPLDFNDPSVRRRGRGLGLELIHAVMTNVHYYPGTPEGNVTILEFNPAANKEKVEHE